MIVDSTQYSAACACGKQHSMNTRAAIIEPGALACFEQYMTRYNISGKRCAIYGENAYRATQGKHPAVQQEIVLDPKGLHANEISTAYVLEHMEQDVEVLIAIGSGTIHDITRYCAHDRGIPFVSVPTAASVDGFCSTVAAMTWYGFKKTLPAVAPEIVVADVDIIKNAPIALVRSGVGDIMAKYIALADWRMAHELTGEYLCRTIYDITKAAADMAMSSIPGILSGDTGAYENVTYALIMSGLAMQMMGNSRPASGAEHHVSHLIEMEPERLEVGFPAMHGEKTGVGAVLVSRRYHELAGIQEIQGLVKPYQALDRAEVSHFFGDRLKDAILTENETDCLSVVTPEVLTETWPKLRRIIAEIPEADQLYSLLERLDAKRSLTDIGVSDADLDTVFKYSAMVRNRLTLMRTCRMLDI